MIKYKQIKKRQRDNEISIFLMACLPKLREPLHDKFGDLRDVHPLKVMKFCKSKTSQSQSSSTSTAPVARGKRNFRKNSNEGCMICGANHRLSGCALLKKKIPEAKICNMDL
ncbi:hypothetical protein SKUD_166603 [Saccharomyces kudriavzevii IFO 1802]|uniref:Uncharacterized protein n=1 Tax=Saccharomyces kudriavzevii (strain ATCC MYA-4449 / AS 2.2408 / CBS 8840 / NBRC 1802 / NCYC 2889) TaxID=226230 RepID=J6EHX3_SACK1|nr:hypothetical protein SKUD_166603 [Saccharomyces kudriavzevii IFO 1802]